MVKRTMLEIPICFNNEKLNKRLQFPYTFAVTMIVGGPSVEVRAVLTHFDLRTSKQHNSLADGRGGTL